MSVEAVRAKYPEASPWLENGEISRDKVARYVQAEQADMDASLKAGQDVHLIIERHQAAMDRHLSGWSEHDRLNLLTIYSQESTAQINASTASIVESNKNLEHQQKSMKAGAYGMVIAFAVILIIIYISTGR
ncbi:hypothetical protein [Pseudomonas viridiflava]|uniref:hypothetical protein n=1 Tax=Pseudomonas viridiflava TaxID=33069 RepID=UPI000F041185|nr:hypothetical protein [Pseudomonas viridiflava]